MCPICNDFVREECRFPIRIADGVSREFRCINCDAHWTEMEIEGLPAYTRFLRLPLIRTPTLYRTQESLSPSDIGQQ